MNLVLLDTPQARNALSPFADTRVLAKLRIGIHTIEEKWERYFQTTASWLTAPHLSEKFPCAETEKSLCINSTICPDEALIAAIKQLEPHQQLVQEDEFIAAYCTPEELYTLQKDPQQLTFEKKFFNAPLTQVQNKWDIFLLNAQELRKDFAWICQQKLTQSITDPNTVSYNSPDIFIEPGVAIKAAILNAEEGPIYLGKDVTIHEGAVIKGPVAICEGAQVSSNAIISNATTIGPYSKVGGEVSNTIILGYSNKAHEGFMGNSVIGEWCNLGAGSVTSNLRSDYGPVKIWNKNQGDFEKTALQFCGLFMGDHSKCGINTMFNAGTIVGVNTNLFGAGFFEKYIPSFTWGSPGQLTKRYLLDKALATAEKMTSRRQVQFTEQDKKILTHTFTTTD